VLASTTRPIEGLDANHKGLPRPVFKAIAAERRPLGALRHDATSPAGVVM